MSDLSHIPRLYPGQQFDLVYDGLPEEVQRDPTVEITLNIYRLSGCDPRVMVEGRPVDRQEEGPLRVHVHVPFETSIGLYELALVWRGKGVGSTSMEFAVGPVLQPACGDGPRVA